MGTPPLRRSQQVWDVVLALGCMAVVVWIHVSGIDAVPANRPTDALSVLFTIAALAPLALRRRVPALVVALCFPGFLALVALGYSVGAAPVGVLVAFYTAVAWGDRRDARIGVGVVVVGYAAALLLRPVDLSVEGAVVQAALLIAGWVVGTGARERREYHAVRVAEAERRVQQERERVAFAHERAAHAAMEERLRITRELHDILGHAFSLMVVQAGVAEHLIDHQPQQARRALAELGATGRTSLSEMRRLLHVLRDSDDVPQQPREPQPTLSDVAALVDRVRAAGLPVELDVDGEPTPLSAGVELAAYRVIQEALTNCIKHARASGARVHLSHADGALAIEVSDDGQPTTNGQAPHEGHGLAGMRERVAMYGGTLNAGATPHGYRVRATLPAQPPAVPVGAG